MATALCLTVRLLEPRYHGLPEWPPAPARLFQALVAGAAEGRHLPADAHAALEWLERQEPPRIAAPHAGTGRGFTNYVPNNDGGASELGGDPTRVIRIGKDIRPRLLHADAGIVYVWPDIGEDAPVAALEGVAERLYQLGRGVDPAFAELCRMPAGEAEKLLAAHPGQVHLPGAAGQGGLPCPVPGSLESLVRRHAAFLGRLATVGSGRARRTTFANPPRPRFRAVCYDVPPTRLVFDLRGVDRRFALQPAERAGPLVAGLLAAAARKLERGLDPADRPLVARFVAGMGAGPRDLDRRVRVFALPTVRDRVDRAIRRVAVEIPPGCPIRADDLDWAFSGLVLADAGTGEVDASDARLVPARDRRMLERDGAPSCRWRSEIALALPIRGGAGRGERAGREARARAAVAAALRHAGIRVPVTAIRVQREPFAPHGTRAEFFAAGTRFSTPVLWHVELTFAQPVAGPLILGDGRFAGLGLMLPVMAASGVHAFRIAGGLSAAAPEDLAAALRRAVMARAAGPGGRLDPLVSGHDTEGVPLRPGDHRHIACLADLPRGRLLVVAPHLLAHRAPTREETESLAALEQCLTGFSTLRAGRAGLLRLVPGTVDTDDPLLAPARCWESLSPYRVTRHPKAGDPAAALAADIAGEIARLGLPHVRIEVLDHRTGPRGGLSGTARLTFRTAVPGPILLGRTRHKGGGVFAGVKGGEADR